MAEYFNQHFSSYILGKDIEEQLLMENPVVLSNFQQVKRLDDFIRSLLPSQTISTSDHQMESFQGKMVKVKQGQASLSVSYTRHDERSC